jgi:hypothetical protein
MGYGDEQIGDLRKTIDASDASSYIGTPIDLRKLVDFDRPALRVTYRLQEVGSRRSPTCSPRRGLLAGSRERDGRRARRSTRP